MEFSVVTIRITTHVTLNFIAKNGFIADLAAGGGGVVISKISATAVSRYLRDAFPQNLPDLEKNRFILVGGHKVYLDQCDQNLKYLFDIIEDQTLPFEERKKVAYSGLTKYLNLKTQFGRRNFVLCIVFIIYILFNNRHSSFYLMMKSLIKAIREGKITKPMARLIVRKLIKQGVPIEPELAEMVAS